MASNAKVHVVFRGDSWAVSRDNAERANSVHATKNDALAAARRLAKHEQAELVIHNRDGKISDSDSYGNDPRGSRDRVR